MSCSPRKNGIVTLDNIDLYDIVKYINWTYFFNAWKVSGKYEGIEKVCLCNACETTWLHQFNPAEREKAKEALKLFRDAQQLLGQVVQEKLFVSKATFSIMKARSANEGIVFYPENADSVYIPMLRQQNCEEGYCLSLADFVSPDNDYAGVFAVSISGADDLKEKYNAMDDTYNALLVQSLADRVAEASTEWLHEQIRKKYWGYAPDENLNITDMFKAKYQGIRPAVGYPSLPDQSVIFLLDKMLTFSRIGISITENGAMYPTASTCGLLIAHAQSAYFMVGRIGKDQLADYAVRKGITVDEARKWLSAYM